MKNMTFKVGDKVQSAQNSSDVRSMKAIWVAEIIELKAENDNGGCYETLGKWEPIISPKGTVHPLWAKHNPNEKPGLRQLWGDSLVLTHSN